MKKPFIFFLTGGIVVLALAVASFAFFKSDKKIAGAVTQKINFSPNPLPVKKSNCSNPDIRAKAAYLIDVDSALPMFAKNENSQLPIASTTKIATALVVLENFSDQLNEVVTITPKMNNVEETRIGLLRGEKITVKNLLHGLLINSGNDAAYALGEHFGGIEKFAGLMNSKVNEIGLKETEYFDPAGLNDKGRSTAKELAILGSYALRNKEFSEIVKISKETIYSTDGRYKHELVNSNRLVQPEESLYFPWAIGVKTGFTYEAGHVLVSAAEKDGHKILAVVLNTYKNTKPASAEESRKLLDWGFSNWTWPK